MKITFIQECLTDDEIFRAMWPMCLWFWIVLSHEGYFQLSVLMNDCALDSHWHYPEVLQHHKACHQSACTSYPFVKLQHHWSTPHLTKQWVPPTSTAPSFNNRRPLKMSDGLFPAIYISIHIFETLFFVDYGQNAVETPTAIAYCVFCVTFPYGCRLYTGTQSQYGRC